MTTNTAPTRESLIAALTIALRSGDVQMSLDVLRRATELGFDLRFDTDLEEN